MRNEKLSKLTNYLLLFAVFLGVFIWSTVQHNASANVDQNSAKIYFLDVGEGDSALILLAQNKEILIDTGKPGTLLGKLSAKMPSFDKEIEAVFLSHPDNDHIGSFEELSNSYKIDKLYFNGQEANSATAKKVQEIAKQKNIPEFSVNAGDNFYFGGLKIEALWPLKNFAGLSDNDASEVLKVSFAGSKVLFTGDIEIKGQEALLRENGDLTADLIKVPHHGSAGAFDEQFLKKVAPNNAVISVGPNSYGHPTKTVLDGLANLGINIFRTDDKGTVEFVATDSGWVKK